MTVWRGDEDAQAHASRTGLLKGLDLAHANLGRELVSFADGHFGVGCSALEGFGDNVGGE